MTLNTSHDKSRFDTILIFGGVYSNLQALEAMKRVSEEREIPPDRIYCTGDMAAYCADPEETIRACHAWGIHVVQGNCEEQLGAGADDCGCGFEEGSICSLLSDGWYSFANRRVSPDMRAWMAGLPKRLEFTYAGLKCCVIHGGYRRNNEFIFPSTSNKAKKAIFEMSGADIIICGHSGIPFVEAVDERIWFNAGVIGMPANDGTRDGWYGLIECQDGRVKASTHRLSYDAEAAAGRLRRAGFADSYADALENGLWPSEDILPDRERRARGNALVEQSAIVNAAVVM